MAECESGGSWSADTGNGRYGGLQLTQANWEKYGGLEYAATADQASRSQQIAVAEKVLAGQGVGVWATCGLLHNLGGDSGSADVDTGVADDSSDSEDSSSSSGSSDTSDSSASTDAAKSGKSADSTDSTGPTDSTGSSGSRGPSESSESSGSSADVFEGSTKARTGTDSDDSAGSGSADSDKSGQSDSSSAADDSEGGTGRHRGASADEDVDADTEAGTDAADGSRTDSASSGRHASRDGDAAREVVDGAYTVQAGDSLTGIVNSLGLGGGWRELYAENEATVGTDPDLILPGQTLEVGVETGEK